MSSALATEALARIIQGDEDLQELAVMEMNWKKYMLQYAEAIDFCEYYVFK